MILVEDSTVPKAALPVALFKNYMRLGSGFSDDGLQDDVLETSLRSALASVEARTGKLLLQRDVTWSLHTWRGRGAQVLPVAPVQEILSVTLMDKNGAATPWPSTQWALQKDTHEPQLCAVNGCLPTVPHAGSVQVNLKAGYSTQWANVPAGLGQAALTLAAHFYEFRYDSQGATTRFPMVVESLIEPFLHKRMLGGFGR